MVIVHLFLAYSISFTEEMGEIYFGPIQELTI